MSSYYHLRIAAQDKLARDYDENGIRKKVPYCVVNSNRFYIPNTRLENLLQSTTEEMRGNEEDSLNDFIERLNMDNLLWRTPIGIEEGMNHSSHFNTGIRLNINTNAALKNTGLGDLLVGDRIYMMPAISFFANINHSVNVFQYNGKTYVHPMLLGEQDKELLEGDVLMLDENSKDADPVTDIGRVMKRQLLLGKKLDLAKILMYMKMMKPVGVVKFNVEGYRRSVYDVGENKIPIGSNFICKFHQF